MGISHIMQRYDIIAKKSLGQNFLSNEGILQKIATSIDIHGQYVVEVGPGFGALTTYLAQQQPMQLDLVELDGDMVEVLQDRQALGDFGEISLQIHSTDVLSWQLPQEGAYVFGNIPYYITSPIIRHFLYGEVVPEVMVFLMQKEVADKILCTDGKHSVLSLLVTYRCKSVHRVCRVSRGSFVPAPRVDSAVLQFDVDPVFDAHHARQFEMIVCAGFSEKRKKLFSNLKKHTNIDVSVLEQAWDTCGLDTNVRAESLSLETWKQLMQHI